jgi:hypothetical protein
VKAILAVVIVSLVAASREPLQVNPIAYHVTHELASGIVYGLKN